MISLKSVSKFFLFSSVFFVAIVSTSTLFPFIVGKYVWFRSSVVLALIAFLLALIFDPEAPQLKKQLRQVFSSPLTWAVTAFTVAFLLACLFGVNPSFSFWSNFERGEGGFQMLHLYAFFILLATLFRDPKDWRLMFILAMGAAWLMILYGLGGAWGVKGFVGSKFSDPGFRFAGSIGNPAYVATYLIFSLFYALYLFFDKYRQKLASFGGVFTAISILGFLAFFYFAATRGALLGLVAGIAVFAVYFVFTGHKYRKQAIAGLLAVLVLVAGLISLRGNPTLQKIPGFRIFDISISAKTFQDRAIMWKTAWDGFRERPVFGYGPEEFLRVFDEHLNPKYFDPKAGFGAWFDRAHSFIFDYLAETGLVGLLSFLSIFVAFIYEFFRMHRKTEEASLTNFGHSRALRGLVLALPAAYLVQGLVLFDVLSIYYNLFLFLGFSAFLFIAHRNLKA